MIIHYVNNNKIPSILLLHVYVTIVNMIFFIF